MGKELIIDIENHKDNDLISRQAVKEVFPKWKFISYEAYLCSVLEIDKLPSVSTKKTGHWTKDKEPWGGSQGWKCDKCNHIYDINVVYSKMPYNFCPNCGAKMESEPQESEE